MSDELPTPDAYFDSKRGQFWFNKLAWNQAAREAAEKNGMQINDEYTPLNVATLKLYLRELGYSLIKPADKPLSPVEEQIMAIMRYKEVDYAGPLAGFRAGEKYLGGKAILVTASPSVVEAQEGDFSTLETLIGEQFGPDQLPYVLGWLRAAREALTKGVFRPGQLVALAGEAGAGKSLFQSLITEMIGGRVAKPYRYMTGNTQFNSELFAAEHLAIEDEAASTDLRTRREFGAHIKNLIVNESHSFHGKGRDAMTLPAFWRVTVSLNDEPENLMVLPPLDESLRDKVMLFKLRKPSCFEANDTLEKRKKFRQQLTKELPAFCHMLSKWKIPWKLKDQRYGVKAYQNPELLEQLNVLSPEHRLAELIDGAELFGKVDNSWQGTATDLEKALRAYDAAAAERLFTFNSACGTYLARLRNKEPDRFETRKNGGLTKWIIRKK